MNDIATIHVYVGTFGTYPIPADVLLRAEDANKGKPLSDRRTRGAKIIEAWGRERDMGVAA